MIGRLPGKDGNDLVQAWDEALTSLEHDLVAAEQLLAGPLDVVATSVAGPGWVPPALGGPVPRGLVARARDLLRRQSAVREGLGRALEQSRADLAQLRSGATGGVRSAAYVDISA